MHTDVGDVVIIAIYSELGDGLPCAVVAGGVWQGYQSRPLMVHVMCVYLFGVSIVKAGAASGRNQNIQPPPTLVVLALVCHWSTGIPHYHYNIAFGGRALPALAFLFSDSYF